MSGVEPRKVGIALAAATFFFFWGGGVRLKGRILTGGLHDWGLAGLLLLTYPDTLQMRKSAEN